MNNYYHNEASIIFIYITTFYHLTLKASHQDYLIQQAHPAQEAIAHITDMVEGNITGQIISQHKCCSSTLTIATPKVKQTWTVTKAFKKEVKEALEDLFEHQYGHETVINIVSGAKPGSQQ